jgi:DNA-binding LacI/PurR family transcriptional regulator
MPRKPSKAPTIKDVAVRAAVSIGTVSRVLNDHPDVAVVLRDRVEEAIRGLGYRAAHRDRDPNRTRVIGFLLCNGHEINLVQSHLLLGIERFCSEAGFYTIFARHSYSPHTSPEKLQIPELLTNRDLVDCVVVAGINYENLLRALDHNKIRYVLLENHLTASSATGPRTNRIRYDDHGGCYEAARYLIELGHKHIWYIGDTSRPWFLNRYEGYAKALREHGLEPKAHTVALADDPVENGRAAVRYILEQKFELTAVICGSEDLAIGARDALRQHGYDVPRRVSLIGFEHQVARSRTSNLTSVCVDTVEVGRQLAKMAVARVNSFGADQDEIVVPAKLIKRASCGPLRRGDAMVL